MCKPDLQDFFKRLRAAGHKFRYFAVGEYGAMRRRPHYHVLFFGQDWREDSYRYGMGEKSPNEYYGSPVLDKAWGMGRVTCAPVEEGSAFYVAGYALKNFGDVDCFHLASRRPPIGHEWVVRFHDDAIRNGFVTIAGVRHRVPPAYLERPQLKLAFDWLKEKRREYMRTFPQDELAARRERHRSKEINMAAGAARARGSL